MSDKFQDACDRELSHIAASIRAAQAHRDRLSCPRAIQHADLYLASLRRDEALWREASHTGKFPLPRL